MKVQVSTEGKIRGTASMMHWRAIKSPSLVGRLGALFLCGAASAQTVETQQVGLVSSYSGFYLSVTADGDRLAVRHSGAPFDNAIALWHRTHSGWSPDGRIRAETQGTVASFATRIVLSDDRLIVGSVNHSNYTGVVHWMERGAGGWRSFFTPADRIESPFGPIASFGWAIDANERWLAISARRADGVGYTSTGAVVLYERVPGGWNRHSLITPPASSVVANLMSFGHALALDGDTLAISNLDISASYVGAVFLYDFTAASGWTLASTFSDPDPHSSDEFGWDVALSDGVLVVGERRETTNSPQLGLAHIIERSMNGTWSYTREIVASNGVLGGNVGDEFGQHVETDGSTIVVASNRALGVNNLHGDGAIYVFRRRPDGTWNGTEDERLYASVAGERGLGIAMAYSDGTVVAAAYNAVSLPSGLWPIYVFTPGVGTDICDGTPAPSVARAHLDVLTDDPARPSIALWGAPAGTQFVVLASASLVPGPTAPGGATCLAWPSVRAAFGRFDAAGGPVLTELEIPRIAALGSGQWTEPLYLQAWTRTTTGETAISQAVRIIPR